MMEISKETRIKVFIFVDVVFFLIEIIVGYTAHSLALVADAFHMLNDVISLCVGLWAVRVATNRSSSNEYTYGWARAEILGGLINGVFLVALCLSIVLEAIQRFFEPQEVSNPKLVLIVGSIGLAFNILGLFVFHQHDHSHDEAEHEHDHAHAHDELSHAEQGHSHSHDSHASSENTDKTAVDAHSSHPDPSRRATVITFQTPDTAVGASGVDESAPSPIHRVASSASRRIRRARSGSRGSLRAQSITDATSIHPAYLRNNIISQARYSDDLSGSDTSTTSEERDDLEEGEEVASHHHGHDDHDHVANGEPSEVSPLLGQRIPSKSSSSSGKHKSQSRLTTQAGASSTEAVVINGDPHKGHKHNQPRAKAAGGHGHSHADMNIRGMFLHVLGDALGNVGVMASALIIWLTSWSFRFYFDPLISLFITLIILKSAIPLCKETAKPLLQAAPTDVSVDDIIEDVKSLPGIADVHHLHVWCLTPTRRVATLHAQMDFNYDAKKYMEVAKEIKHCLRGFGIHSSTIQPEFQYYSSSGVMCQLDGNQTGEEAMKCCTPPEGSGTVTPSGGGNNKNNTQYGT